MRTDSSLSAKEICSAVLAQAARKDERLRSCGETDVIDDKTVFVIKRSAS